MSHDSRKDKKNFIGGNQDPTLRLGGGRLGEYHTVILVGDDLHDHRSSCSSL